VWRHSWPAHNLAPQPLPVSTPHKQIATFTQLRSLRASEREIACLQHHNVQSPSPASAGVGDSSAYLVRSGSAACISIGGRTYLAPAKSSIQTHYSTTLNALRNRSLHSERPRIMGNRGKFRRKQQDRAGGMAPPFKPFGAGQRSTSPFSRYSARINTCALCTLIFFPPPPVAATKERIHLLASPTGP